MNVLLLTGTFELVWQWQQLFFLETFHLRKQARAANPPYLKPSKVTQDNTT